jgi:hypothetical protein
MNANELADALETMTTGWFDDLTLTQSATMLRQQQAEIEALKKEAALQRLSDFTQEVEKTLIDDPLINFKPVWIEKPELTLTDEEIRKVADEVFKDYKNWHHYQVDFARAILRKAQDK